MGVPGACHKVCVPERNAHFGRLLTAASRAPLPVYGTGLLTLGGGDDEGRGYTNLYHTNLTYTPAYHPWSEVAGFQRRTKGGKITSFFLFTYLLFL